MRTWELVAAYVRNEAAFLWWKYAGSVVAYRGFQWLEIQWK